MKNIQLFGKIITSQTDVPEWILEHFPEKDFIGLYVDRTTNITYVDLEIEIPFMLDENNRNANKKIYRYCIPVISNNNVVNGYDKSIGEYEIFVKYNDFDEFIHEDNSVFTYVEARPIVRRNDFNYVRNNAGIPGETEDLPGVFLKLSEDSPILAISESGVAMLASDGGIIANDGHVKITTTDLYTPSLKKQTAYLLPGKEDVLNQSINISGDAVMPWVGLQPDFVAIMKSINDIIQVFNITAGVLNFVYAIYNTGTEIKKIAEENINIKTNTNAESQSENTEGLSNVSDSDITKYRNKLIKTLPGIIQNYINKSSGE